NAPQVPKIPSDCRWAEAGVAMAMKSNGKISRRIMKGEWPGHPSNGNRKAVRGPNRHAGDDAPFFMPGDNPLAGRGGPL
ncbi:MAG: hypothetical protein ACXWU6_15410, partial [Allosphingosinicella sp.]